MADEWSPVLARALKCSVILSWILPLFCQGKSYYMSQQPVLIIDDLGPLKVVRAICVMKVRFDETCVLEYDLQVDERVEVVFTGFRDLVTEKTQVG